MTAKNICRIGDTVTGTCRAPVSGHPRTFTGIWQTGSGNISFEGPKVVRVGDTGITDCGHHFVATIGSSIATANGIAIMRVGDTVIVTEGGEGVCQTGAANSTSL